MTVIECPVCSTYVDDAAIASHVNAHFEEEEPARKKVRRDASSELASTNTTRTEKKCENCGELILAHDWIRHNAVHDDEAIAVCAIILINSIS
jgi:hypothetical protein